MLQCNLYYDLLSVQISEWVSMSAIFGRCLTSIEAILRYLANAL